MRRLKLCTSLPATKNLGSVLGGLVCLDKRAFKGADFDPEVFAAYMLAAIPPDPDRYSPDLCALAKAHQVHIRLFDYECKEPMPAGTTHMSGANWLPDGWLGSIDQRETGTQLRESIAWCIASIKTRRIGLQLPWATVMVIARALLMPREEFGQIARRRVKTLARNFGVTDEQVRIRHVEYANAPLLGIWYWKGSYKHPKKYLADISKSVEKYAENPGVVAEAPSAPAGKVAA